MYKKEIVTLVIAILLLIPVFYDFDFNAKSLANNINFSSVDYSDVYDINIVHSNNTSGKRKTYKIASTPIDLDKAKTYAGLFSLTEYFETEMEYIFKNNFESLTIIKDGSKLFYKNISKSNSRAEKINEQQAKLISESFIKSRMLPLDYSICEITHLQNTSAYEILFINTVEGIKNYAFPKTVEIDEYGNIISVLYYNYAYIPLGQISVMSESKAVDILLSTQPSETGYYDKIDIKHQELVYNKNANGDLYPYYRFCGQIKGNKGFECFIRSFKLD